MMVIMMVIMMTTMMDGGYEEEEDGFDEDDHLVYTCWFSKALTLSWCFLQKCNFIGTSFCLINKVLIQKIFSFCVVLIVQ